MGAGSSSGATAIWVYEKKRRTKQFDFKNDGAISIYFEN